VVIDDEYPSLPGCLFWLELNFSCSLFSVGIFNNARHDGAARGHGECPKLAPITLAR